MVRFFFALAFALIVSTPEGRASRMASIELHSALLSAFWQAPMTLHADVLLPDSYDADRARRYPVIYWFPGYGGDYDLIARKAWGDWVRAFDAEHREAIVVFPDPMLGYVYTAFADSVNTGPWGAAFTMELVPYVDASFRTDGRFLAGHSSGAWAALWLQTAYPSLFNGEWSYAPDPADFHDFTGPDLTATPVGNFYERGRGQLYHTVRKSGSDTETLRDFANGARIDQLMFLSFEAVFSPNGADGGAERLFNRATGAIDPTVAAYWEEHYDITALVNARWAQIGPLLNGKIHVIVGTQDTFHLDGPARRFCAMLTTLGARAGCTFDDGGDHWSILVSGGGYEHHIIDEIFLTVPG
jgi:S-formylglutathione hydrolase FrmB